MNQLVFQTSVIIALIAEAYYWPLHLAANFDLVDMSREFKPHLLRYVFTFELFPVLFCMIYLKPAPHRYFRSMVKVHLIIHLLQAGYTLAVRPIKLYEPPSSWLEEVIGRALLAFDTYIHSANTYALYLAVDPFVVASIGVIAFAVFKSTKLEYFITDEALAMKLSSKASCL